MDIYRVIRDLVEERNRVDRIIASLEEMAEGGKQSTSSASRDRRGRKSMDEPARKEVSERMKRYWANRQKEQAKPKPKT